MVKNRSGIVLGLLFYMAMGMAQQQLTLEDLIPGGKTHFKYVPENIQGLQWWGERCIVPEIDQVNCIDAVTGKEAELFQRAEVNKVLEEAGLKPVQHFYGVSFPLPDRPVVLLTSRQEDTVFYIYYNFNDHAVEKVIAGGGNSDLHPTTGQLVYTVSGSLYYNNGTAKTEACLIEAAEEGVVYGEAVHRHEFGITKGTFWNPEGTRVAFYKMDERMVSSYPLVDISGRISVLHPVKYPMAGMESHKVAIGIYDPVGRTTVYLNTGDPTDRYFTNISWSPDGNFLYLIELNRAQNHAKLCRYSAITGELDRVVFEEQHPRYVEPQHPIVFLPWNDQQFIYQSQQDGYNHLYLYDVSGKLVRQLTQGEWIVKELLGFNEKQKEVLISTTEISPLQANLYRVDTGNGRRMLVGDPVGVHNVRISRSGRYVIDNWSSPDIPRKVEIIDTYSGQSRELLTANDPYSGVSMPLIEVGTIKAADNETDLYYRLVKPVEMEPGRKYPVIVYVYGGPHAQLVTGGWQSGVRGWDLYMALNGYVVFTLDNRGSSNRGIEFENVTFRYLGIEEGKDQIKGVDFLKSLPYVDESRIGVHGWSFGGHMAAALLLRYPDVFKVGVAGGPVIDWKYYEVMYGERYMDTPEENPEGYQVTNLNNLAGNLQGKLLIIHDDMDDICVPQHTISFIKACVDAGTFPDLFIYPGHGHNVRGSDRVHLYEKVTRYFEEHLK